MISTSIIILIMIILLILSGLVSGSEVAFFSLSPKTIIEIQESNAKPDEKAKELLNKPQHLLATILITNNFINVAIVLISTYITNDFLALLTISSTSKFIIQVIVVTFMILLIGEIIPKVFASKNPKILINTTSIPLYYLNKFFSFIKLNNILVFIGGLADKHVKKSSFSDNVNHLEYALEITSKELDEHSENEKKILEGIVKFGNTDVKQIMRSRVDVTAFDIKTTFEELLPEILISGFSRIPIYDDTFDQIKGVLYTKDLLPFIDKPANFNWSSLIRKPFFVPENKKIDQLLQEFQSSKIHLAVVVDEYGGTSGIITLEDIIEEIVGDISDESHQQNEHFQKIGPNTFIFEGKTPLVDFYKVLEINGEIFEEEKGEADTLAGFIIEKTGEIPTKNKQFNFNKCLFTIVSSTERKINKIKVKSNYEV